MKPLNLLYALLHPVLLLPWLALLVAVWIERRTAPACYVEPEGKWWKE